MDNNYLKNKLIGASLACYSGYSLDADIRYHSSSGGLITSVLKFMFEEGLIDGALVVRMKKKDPLKAESFLARSLEEVVSAQGSKYCPVDMSNGLKDIINSKPDARFAIVGLPCQVRAFKKLKKIQRKIVLYLGLFCYRTPNNYATRVFLKKTKINPEDVLRIAYRGEGWPGYMKIVKKNGEKILILSSKAGAFLLSDFFIPKRCFLCGDHTAELADVSFGDAWLSQFKNDKKGRSIIITRTLRGQKIIEEVKNKKVANLSLLSRKEIILSQLIPLYLKKKSIKPRSFLFGKKNKDGLRSDFLDFVFAVPSWLVFNLSRFEVFKRIIEKLPFSTFNTYNRITNNLYSRKARHDFKKIIN